MNFVVGIVEKWKNLLFWGLKKGKQMTWHLEWKRKFGMIFQMLRPCYLGYPISKGDTDTYTKIDSSVQCEEENSSK